MKPIRILVSLTLAAAFLAAMVGLPTQFSAVAAPNASSTVVISQVYGGGGGSTGTYIYDYIELYNISAVSQSLDGMSLQYAPAAGNFTNVFAIPAGKIIPAGGYLLVQSGNAGTGGVAFPVTSDLTAGLNLAAGSGKVALANITTALGCGASGTTPNLCVLPHPNIVDLVGYGAASQGEGGTTVNNGVALVNTQGSIRKGNGCKDTDNNNADFSVVTAPIPRNSGSPLGTCVADPAVTKTGPAQASPGDIINYLLTVSNQGILASDTVLVTDTLPVDVSFITYTSSVPVTYLGYTTPDVSWELNSLAITETVLITVEVQILPSMPDMITNSVQITSSSTNNGRASNDQAQFVTEYPKPALSVTKSGLATSVGGMDLVYDIGLQNTGILTATNVVLTDTITGGATYVTDNSGFPHIEVVPGTLVWNLGDLGPGFSASYQITYTANLTPTRDVINAVEVTTDALLDDPLDNSDSQTTQVYGLSTIAEARAGATNQVFAIQGKVTVPPGIYQGPEWVLQDETGGIGVFYTPAPVLALGDSVILVAPRTLFSGQEQMGTPLYFKNLGSGAPVDPKLYTTSAVASGASEGWLVQVQGTVSALPATCSSTANYQFNIDDGSGSTVIYVDKDTHIDVCAMGVTNGSTIRVNGFSTAYNTLMEIKPRYVTDVILNMPQIRKDAPAVVAPGQVFTYTLTASNKLGYDLTDVVITDTLPADTELASILDAGSQNGSEIRWTLTSLSNNTTASVRFVVTATTTLTTIGNLDYAITAGNFITPTYGMPVYTVVTASGILSIHNVQGAGDASLLVGATVQNVEGVVVGKTNDGFFMQEPNPDDNAATSEGIFVWTNTAPTVVVSDTVSVNGLVAEYNGLTELKNVTITPLVSTATITPTELTLPIAVDDSLEHLEGMWVTIPTTMTVSQNYFQGRYGQLTLSANGRMYNPTNGNGLGDTFEYDTRRMLVLDDNKNSENPNPIPYIGEGNTTRAGDTVTNLTGVLDQGIISSGGIVFYRLQPLAAPVITRVNARTTAPEAVGGNVQIGSFNVLNYFNGNGLGGGFPTSRGANTLLEFERQRTKIITAMVALDADVLGLMEIENDGTGNLSAIHDLVSGLNLLVTDPYTYTVEPAPGTDEIKVALIYKPSVVTPVGPAQNFQVTDHPVYQPLFDRPPLAQTFTLNENGEKFTVIVNHFKSKGSCPVSGPDVDQGDGQGCWTAKRVAQAAGLLDIISSIQSSTGDQDVLVIGDLNSYGQEDPILAFLAGNMTDLSAQHVPDEERYSYTFDGLAGELDHALGTANLAKQTTGVTIWHINTDEPSVLDYNTEYKPQDLYTPTPYASSDHDPVLIGLDLQPYRLFLPIILR